MMRWSLLLGILLCAYGIGGQISPANAQTLYHVAVNTAGVSGQSGYVDLQFNPGGVDALAANATVSSVVTDGTFVGGGMNTGDVSGSLPGPLLVSINNTTVFNDVFQGFTFGNTLACDVTFSGAVLTPTSPLPTSGSAFALSLYASDQITPLLTTDASGSLLQIALNPDGSTTAQTFPSSANGGVPVATATLAAPAAVPEPGSLSLLVGAEVSSVSLFARRRLRGK